MDEVYWMTGREDAVGQGLRHAVDLLRGLAYELGATNEYQDASLFVQTTAQVQSDASLLILLLCHEKALKTHLQHLHTVGLL